MPRAAFAVLLWFAIHLTVQACGNEPPLEELSTPQFEGELADAYEHALESSAARESLMARERSLELRLLSY